MEELYNKYVERLTHALLLEYEIKEYLKNFSLTTEKTDGQALLELIREFIDTFCTIMAYDEKKLLDIDLLPQNVTIEKNDNWLELQKQINRIRNGMKTIMAGMVVYYQSGIGALNNSEKVVALEDEKVLLTFTKELFSYLVEFLQKESVPAEKEFSLKVQIDGWHDVIEGYLFLLEIPEVADLYTLVLPENRRILH